MIPPMRFLEITTCPGKYMYWHYRLRPGLAGQPYARQKEEFLADGAGAGLLVAREMSALGYAAETVVANNIPLQTAWAGENNFPMPAAPLDLVIEQINRFEPDILYITDCAAFDGRFLSRLGKPPRLVLGWHCGPLPSDADWSGYDLIVSPLAACREAAVARGAVAAEYAFPGFDATQTLSAESIKRGLDVGFSGSWDQAYSRRNALLEILAGAAQREDSGKFSAIFCLNTLNGDELPPAAAALNRGAVWGKRMYALLAGTRVAVNAVSDYAAGQVPNLRHLEATGMGALLLTENHPSLRAFFQEDEVAAFASAEDMLEQVRYYLTHEDERQAVAARGQARCLRDFSTAARARAMDRRIERALRPQSFTPAERETLLRRAGEYIAGGQRGLVEAAGVAVDKDLTAAMWQSFCQGDAPEVAALAGTRAQLSADAFELAFCRCLDRAMRGDLPGALAALRQELDHFPENDRARGIYADLLTAYPA